MKLLDNDIKKYLIDNEFIHARMIPSQGVCGIQRFIFTWGLCCGIINPFDSPYIYRFCYRDFSECYHDLLHWDGNNCPSGDWMKRKGMGGDLLGVNKAHEEALLLGPH